MLCVYDHYKYFYSFSVGFRRQILTSKGDPRAVRVKWILVYSQESTRQAEISVIKIENP